MNRKRIGKLATYIALLVLALLFTCPVLWVIGTSLKRPVDAASLPPIWIFKPQWSNYIEAWNNRFFFFLGGYELFFRLGGGFCGVRWVAPPQLGRRFFLVLFFLEKKPPPQNPR